MWTRVVTAGAALCAAALTGATTALADPEPAPEPAPTPGAEAPDTQAATSIEEDGTYQVGEQILPGTYTSAGPAEDATCYWRRSRDGEIVDNAMTKKPQVVQIEPTDSEFRTSGCQPWQRTDGEQAPPGLDPAAAKNQLRDEIGKLNLGSLLHGGGQVPGP
ncbi:hypothetical protein H7J77_18335 [Mycolicibacillus parakoreensis]|uniref:Lipoprotein n=1 Tax=Mycolicibacillus parakoreensis TaxID=1069221 RepID=A0ABY3U9R4_9MYCO|nr:hypothetical protein [Mycolicibacillus parakoreensis]MCV7317491.1 hypothetical protein [Mycolicibacillus parakoreensis]ULN54208.1 hypothetical protein MIU77_08105 [Mycolicibacillus parakoreensis]